MTYWSAPLSYERPIYVVLAIAPLSGAGIDVHVAGAESPVIGSLEYVIPVFLDRGDAELYAAKSGNEVKRIVHQDGNQWAFNLNE